MKLDVVEIIVWIVSFVVAAIVAEMVIRRTREREREGLLLVVHYPESESKAEAWKLYRITSASDLNALLRNKDSLLTQHIVAEVIVASK